MTNNNDSDWIIRMKLTEEIRRFSTLYIQKTAKGSSYSAQEIDAIFRIRLEDGLISPLELSRRMGVSKPIVSRLLDRLNTKGVIAKTASGSDKRSYYLKLTPKGHDTLRSAYLYYIEPLKILEDKLGSEHFKTLLQLIALANK